MERTFVRCKKIKTHVNMLLRTGHYRWRSGEYYGRLTTFQEGR